MSQVIFNSPIDLQNFGTTPSVGGYTVAYDINDGILKQKDSDGVITPISGSTDLEGALTLGNYSGTYSILMGTATVISSINGNGRIQFDYGNTASVTLTATFSNLLLGLTTSTYTTGYVTQSIPDYDFTGDEYKNFILATISVPVSVRPTDIFVRLEMQHNYFSDVTVNLRAPNGNVINIGGPSVTHTVKEVKSWFTTDTSYPYIWQTLAPYVNIYRADLQLNRGLTPSYRSNVNTVSGLMGGNSTLGNWVLYIEDGYGSDYGTFSKADIYFRYRTGEEIGTNNQTKRDGLYVSHYKDIGRASMQLSTTTFSAYVGTATYSSFIENMPERIGLGHRHVGIGGAKINVIESRKTYDNGSTNKASLHLNTFGSTTAYGVRNSVIVGGLGLWASQSYTTYLGNFVNINNRYTLPNTDGLPNQILTTNGMGTASWATFSANPSLERVLGVGSYSGANHILMGPSRDIILGTFSSIRNISNKSIVSLDYNSTDLYVSPNGPGFFATASAILMSTQSVQIGADSLKLISLSASVTTSNLQGLKYTDNYNSTFVTYSLVTKSYVDTFGGGYNTHLIVYVDPNNGNNLTGAVGKPNLPYQSIASAMIGITGSAYSSTNRGLIHLRKGNYTEVARLENNVDYYCEPGVVFTENGFRDYSAVTSNIWGGVSFIGIDPSLTPIVLQYNSTVVLNFDVVDNYQSIGRLYGNSSNLTMAGNRITNRGQAGYGLSVENGSSLTLRVRDFVRGAYDTIRFQSTYSGNSLIETPYIFSDGSIGSSGVSATLTKALFVGSAATGVVWVKGNIHEVSPTYIGGNQAAAMLMGGNVTIDGNVSGNNSYGLYVYESPITPFFSRFSVVVNGDITSKREALYVDHDYMDVNVKNSLIKSDGIGAFTQSVYMGSSASMYFSNSTIYNGLTDSNIMRVEAEESTIGIYNSLAYSPGTNGIFLYCTYSDYTIGLHNLRSNKDNADNITDLFDPSGFIYDPYLFVPNF